MFRMKLRGLAYVAKALRVHGASVFLIRGVKLFRDQLLQLVGRLTPADVAGRGKHALRIDLGFRRSRP
jgi:hypothetical protein